MTHVRAEFIVYVKDQVRSRDFYAALLDRKPVLDVPGMTEFDLGGCKLGLMPEDGIARIITPALQHPARANGAPRCELYLEVGDVQAYCNRAAKAGALAVSELADRDWGHRVAYYADPDGHVIALAQPIGQ